MADKGNRKIKLLLVKDYLEKYSDEDTIVRAEDIDAMLKNNGIICERKSIYSDIAALKEYGMDIDSGRRGYKLLSRDFELPELRLLIDAVQAANFITAKKSKELIEKITALCSKNQSKQITRQVYIDNRLKCVNEEIYYNIDLINKAISSKKKIFFTYIKRRIDPETKQIVFDEKDFTVSPYALIWSNDHYYLVSNKQNYDNLMHTRIDRMKKVKILDEKARNFNEVSTYKNFFDSADYSGKLFNMFSGETQRLTIRCHNSILEEIFDRFGEGSKLSAVRDDSEDTFTVSAKCVFSDGLISWLMQFGSKIEVISPVSLRESLIKKAEEILIIYNKN
ncbi:MAG: helix-turn-helix transcriptional regulator [Acutalibacteraceae bacterium]